MSTRRPSTAPAERPKTKEAPKGTPNFDTATTGDSAKSTTQREPDFGLLVGKTDRNHE